MQNTPNDDIDTFFSGIYDLSNRIKNIIHNIKLYASADPSYFTAIDFDKIPNISTTLNNKIVEVGIYYKQHDLSFYDFSPLSHIILCDLCSYVYGGFIDLKDFFKITNILTYQGPISKYMPKVEEKQNEPLKPGNIMNYLKERKKRKENSLTADYLFRADLIERLPIVLNNYYDKDTNLFNYDLPQNISTSILKFFKTHPTNITIDNINSIENELAQLDMSCIIPQIQEKLKPIIINYLRHSRDSKPTCIQHISLLNNIPQTLHDAFYQSDLSTGNSVSICSMFEPKHSSYSNNSKTAPISINPLPNFDEID